jgi:hypothetical protein
MARLEDAAVLLTLLERLRQVTATEAALLASFGLRRLHGLQAERRALAEAYTKASAEVALGLLAGLDAPLRGEFERRLQAYHDALAANRAVARAASPVLTEILDTLSETAAAASPQQGAADRGHVIPFPRRRRQR